MSSRGLVKSAELESAPGITTATVEGIARCAQCGREFELTPAILAPIRAVSGNLTPEQSPCLDLPASTFDDPQLRYICPNCRAPIQFNPFLLDVADAPES